MSNPDQNEPNLLAAIKKAAQMANIVKGLYQWVEIDSKMVRTSELQCEFDNLIKVAEGGTV